MIKKTTKLVLASIVLSTSLTASAALSPVQEKIKSAMNMEHRTEADKKKIETDPL